MNITTNSYLLSSLTPLIDPKSGQPRQGTPNQTNNKSSEPTSKVARNSERQNLINANRLALKDLQARLRADNLAKLKTDNLTKLKTGLSVKNSGNPRKSTGSNLNLRESLGRGRNSRPGQIIDIKV